MLAGGLVWFVLGPQRKNCICMYLYARNDLADRFQQASCSSPSQLSRSLGSVRSRWPEEDDFEEVSWEMSPEREDGALMVETCADSCSPPPAAALAVISLRPPQR